MKKTLKSYTTSLIFIFVSTFIFSLFLTILKQNNLINIAASNVVSVIVSLVLFFLAALILGIKIKKKGLINGLILSVIYVCINLTMGFNLSGFTAVIKFISKIVLIILGTIIGVNISK